MSNISLHNLNELSDNDKSVLLSCAEDDLSEYLVQAQTIIDAVEKDGDKALASFAQKFDGAKVDESSILVTDEEFVEARSRLDPKLIETLEFAAGNIKKYHKLQLGSKLEKEVELNPGVFVQEKTSPIASVACYCPRGKGSFPSVALMTLIPASIASVPSITLLTPPGADAKVDDATLVAAQIAGAHHVAKAGGAQAVAAAAFGTKSIKRCFKFEGPGSRWIAAAKYLLSSKIESRLPAGPSESMILADETANANLCALDLLIEAEHGPDSSAFLVTWNKDIASKVIEALDKLIQDLGDKRREYVTKVLTGNNGGVVLACDKKQAYEFVNDFAPEHLQIMSKDPKQHLDFIANASEILLGEDTPGSIANYVLGPNCVLPTNGKAMTHSPLSVSDFQKTSTIARLDKKGYEFLAPHTKRFATYEGFEAHANAVSEIRDKLKKEDN